VVGGGWGRGLGEEEEEWREAGIEELKAEGKRLLASFKDVSDDLKALVAQKKYKRHSIELYEDLDGKGLYLKALAMLGVETPQVKGMEPIEFTESEQSSEVLEFTDENEGITLYGDALGNFIRERRDEVGMSNKELAEATDRSVSTIESYISGGTDPSEEAIQVLAEALDSDEEKMMELLEQDKEEEEEETTSQSDPTGDQQFSQEEVQQQISELQEQKDRLEDRINSFQQEIEGYKEENEQLKFKQRKEQFVSFLDQQVDVGKLPPKIKDKAVELFSHLDGVESDDKEEAPLELFKQFIKDMPEQMDFEEHAKKGSEPEKFATARQIARKASKYKHEQNKHGNDVSYREAVRHVTQNQGD
jgi:transcriptional regulator with XRE-family HTH domain